eukprot:129454_1
MVRFVTQGMSILQKYGWPGSLTHGNECLVDYQCIKGLKCVPNKHLDEKRKMVCLPSYGEWCNVYYGCASNLKCTWDSDRGLDQCQCISKMYWSDAQQTCKDVSGYHGH